MPRGQGPLGSVPLSSTGATVAIKNSIVLMRWTHVHGIRILLSDGTTIAVSSATLAGFTTNPDAQALAAITAANGGIPLKDLGTPVWPHKDPGGRWVLSAGTENPPTEWPEDYVPDD